MNDRAPEHPLPPPLRETAVRRLRIAAAARDDSDTLAHQ